MQSHKNKPKVTLADVAERAGVSKMTVSKVLRGTGSISHETQKKIHRAVEDLGYVKNSLAGLLSSQKSSMIGVIIPSIADSVFAEVLSGTNSVIRPKELNTLIGETLFDPKIEYEVISTMLSLQPAGLILTGGIEHTPATMRLLDKRRCPLISLWDSSNPVGDLTIGFSHQKAGATMARHFLAKGYQNIAYIGSELELDICARQRFEGFQETLTAAGVALTYEISKDAPRQAVSGRLLTQSLHQKHPQTDAIFYLNDQMAIGGLSWMHENNIAIPQQTAAAGFNGTSLGLTVRTKLTTLNVERRPIGVLAAESILDLIAGISRAPITEVDLKFVQGTTT